MLMLQEKKYILSLINGQCFIEMYKTFLSIHSYLYDLRNNCWLLNDKHFVTMCKVNSFITIEWVKCYLVICLLPISTQITFGISNLKSQHPPKMLFHFTLCLKVSSNLTFWTKEEFPFQNKIILLFLLYRHFYIGSSIYKYV